VVIPEIKKADILLDSYKVYFSTEVPELGSSSFFVVKDVSRTFSSTSIQSSEAMTTIQSKMPEARISVIDKPQEVAIESDVLRVHFHPSDGRLTRVDILDPETGKLVDSLVIVQSYWEYPSDNAWGNHYTFKARGPPTEITTKTFRYKLVKTDFVQEFTRVVSSIAWQTYRVYRRAEYSWIEVEDGIGPPSKSSDFVTRYSTELSLNRHFYTDDSGLEMVQRTFDPNILISGNYYPMVYSCFIRDEHSLDSDGHPLQLTYVSNTAHGVTSSRPGELEIMLHRNNVQALANGEKLDDQDEVLLQSWLLLRNREHFHRQRIAMLVNFPLLGISSVPQENVENLKGLAPQKYLSREFPSNVFLNNFEHYDRSSNRVVLRVNHLQQSDGVDYFDHTSLKTNNGITQLPLTELFSTSELSVRSLQERTLSLNQSPEQCNRNHWHHQGEEPHPPMRGSIVADTNSYQFSANQTGSVRLAPMAIHSYFVDIRNKIN
jgi:hypothetical protein